MSLKNKQTTWILSSTLVLSILLGIYLVSDSNAATPFISAEPEAGTAANGAVEVTGDSTASNSQYVRFGPPTPAPTPVPAPSPAPTPAPTPVPSPVPISNRPFSDASLWNTPIPSTVSWRDVSQLRTANWWVNHTAYSLPVVYSRTTDPNVAVNVPATWGWPAGPVTVRVPAGVSGATGTDGTLVIVSGETVCDFWKFTRTSNTTANATAYACSNTVTGTGFGTRTPSYKGAGIRAAGSSSLAGLITSRDFEAGKINHAFGVSLLPTILKRGYIAPAISEDGGNSYSGVLPMGTRMGIPSGVAMPAGLTPEGKMVWDALKTYGAFAVDQHSSSAPVILYADPRSVTAAQVAAIRGDTSKIMPHIRVVQ